MTFDEWFVKYPLPAEIDTMDDTDREQWTWALRSAYRTGAAAEREACAMECIKLAHGWARLGAWGENNEFHDCAVAIRARGQA